jgi:CrcB protein
MAVNVIGCLCIGAMAAWFGGANPPREEWRWAVMIGLLGGFTTFSAFGLETLQLFHVGAVGRATANIVLTNVLCLAAVWAGHVLATRVVAQ